MKLYKKLHSSGFTLLEVLVSATIVAVLMAIGVTSYTTVNQRSRDTKRKSDVEQIRAALEMFRADNGGYPTTASGGSAVSSALSTVESGGYIPKIPTDPRPSTSGNYWYTATSQYAYQLEATLEKDTTTSTNGSSCTPTSHSSISYNYCMKNP